MRRTFDNTGLGADAAPAGYFTFNATGYNGGPLYIANADMGASGQTIPTYAMVNGVMAAVGTMYNAAAQSGPAVRWR